MSMKYAILVLSIYRLTILISEDSGPFNVMERLRQRLSILKKPIGCFYCLSVWVSIPFAMCSSTSIAEFLVNVLAFSGGAIVINAVVSYYESNSLR